MRRLPVLLLVLVVGVVPVLVASPASAESCVSRNDLSADARPAWDSLNPGGVVCVPLVSGQTATQSFATWVTTPGEVQSNYVAPTGAVTSLSRVPMTIGGLTGPVSTVAGSTTAAGINWGAALTNGLLLLGGGLAAWVLSWTGDPDTVLPVEPGSPGPYSYANCTYYYDSSGYTAGSGPCTLEAGYTRDGTTKRGWVQIWVKGAPAGQYAGIPGNLRFLAPGPSGPSPCTTYSGNITSTHGSFDGAVYVDCYWLDSFINDIEWTPSGGTAGSLPNGEQAPASAGGAPARAVQTTVNCRRSDGSTHDVTRTTTVNPDTTNVPGLLCPQGERATGAQVDMVSDLAAGPQTTGVATLAPPAWAAGLDPSCWTATGCVLQQVADPSTSTNPTPTPSLSATPAPTPSPVPDPGGDPEVVPDADFCGIEWTDLLNGLVVFKAVGCALSWAFIPQTPITTRVAEIQEGWNGSSLGTFLGAAFAPIGTFITGWGDNGSSSCAGPAVNYPAPDTTVVMHPWSACDMPMSAVAGTVKLVGTLVLLAAGLIAGVNPVLRAMGAPTLFRRASAETTGGAS